MAKGEKSRKRTVLIIVASVIGIIILVVAGGMIWVTRGLSTYSKLVITDVDLAEVPDGSFQGSFDGAGVAFMDGSRRAGSLPEPHPAVNTADSTSAATDSSTAVFRLAVAVFNFHPPGLSVSIPAPASGLPFPRHNHLTVSIASYYPAYTITNRTVFQMAEAKRTKSG